MKEEILKRLEEFKHDLQGLKKTVKAIPGDRVNRIGIRNTADAIATKWVEELRSPLEHKFRLPDDVIRTTSESMKRLHVLSRPNNLKESYLKTLNTVLHKFDDKFILPIKQSAIAVETVLDLQKLVPGLRDPAESDYLREAIDCANSGFRRAAIVIGWCAAIDRIQRKLLAIGLDKFNDTSRKLRDLKSGRFKVRIPVKTAARTGGNRPLSERSDAGCENHLRSGRFESISNRCEEG